MTRKEVLAEIEKQAPDFEQVTKIIMHNAALRVQFKPIVLTRIEERALINYLYAYGVEDRYVEDRQGANAFFYRYRTLQLIVEELQYIKDILERNEIIFRLYSTLYGSDSFTDTSYISNDKLREELPKLYEIHKKEALLLYDQTRLSLQNVKIKVRELEEILKHYLFGIDEYKEMIKEQKKTAQILTKSIIKLSKDMEQKYNIPAPKKPNHLRSYSQELLDKEELNTNISELINI